MTFLLSFAELRQNSLESMLKIVENRRNFAFSPPPSLLGVRSFESMQRISLVA